MLDRIDLCVEAARISFEDLRGMGEQNESSEIIRERVERAQEIQKKRFQGSKIFFNSEMSSKQVKEYCFLGEREEELLQKAFKDCHLSARGYQKILKVARTVADMEGSGRIGRKHLYEAVGYRDLQEKYWGKEDAV